MGGEPVYPRLGPVAESVVEIQHGRSQRQQSPDGEGSITREIEEIKPHHQHFQAARKIVEAGAFFRDDAHLDIVVQGHGFPVERAGFSQAALVAQRESPAVHRGGQDLKMKAEIGAHSFKVTRGQKRPINQPGVLAPIAGMPAPVVGVVALPSAVRMDHRPSHIEYGPVEMNRIPAAVRAGRQVALQAVALAHALRLRASGDADKRTGCCPAPPGNVCAARGFRRGQSRGDIAKAVAPFVESSGLGAVDGSVETRAPCGRGHAECVRRNALPARASDVSAECPVHIGVVGVVVFPPRAMPAQPRIGIAMIPDQRVRLIVAEVVRFDRVAIEIGFGCGHEKADGLREIPRADMRVGDDPPVRAAQHKTGLSCKRCFRLRFEAEAGMVRIDPEPTKKRMCIAGAEENHALVDIQIQVQA